MNRRYRFALAFVISMAVICGFLALLEIEPKKALNRMKTGSVDARKN